MHNASDAELIQQCQQGNQHAFNTVIRRYQHLVYGLCYHLVGNFTDAQDLAQETFVRVYLHLHQVRSVSSFPAWLRQLTSHVCRRWLRRQATYQNTPVYDIADEDLIAYTPPSPEETIIVRERQEYLWQAMATLPDDQRLAVSLYYLNELSYREVAAFLDIPQTTLKYRLYRARQRLKKELMTMMEHEFKRQRLSEAFSEQVLQEVELTDFRVSVAPRPEWENLLKPIEDAGPEGVSLLGTDNPNREAVQRFLGAIPGITVMLTTKDQQFQLAMTIGHAEAFSIWAGRSGAKPERPMTHDLMLMLLQATHATVQRVIITDLKENAYFTATLLVDFNGVVQEIDCRPSDAMALAARLHLPILVAKKLPDKINRQKQLVDLVKQTVTRAWEEAQRLQLSYAGICGFLRQHDSIKVNYTQVRYDEEHHASEAVGQPIRTYRESNTPVPDTDLIPLPVRTDDDQEEENALELRAVIQDPEKDIYQLIVPDERITEIIRASFKVS